MTLGEAEAAVQAISSKISKDSHVIWGAAIDDDLENHAVRVLAVLSGMKERAPGEQTPAEELNIEFIE
jgi:cell division GTPase FtsZ